MARRSARSSRARGSRRLRSTFASIRCKTTRDDARAALAASGIDSVPTRLLAARAARREPAAARAPRARRGRRARGAGRGQPARRLPGRAAARRDGRRLLRRRGRQDAAPGIADALAGSALRVRRRRAAAREPEAASRALGAFQRPSAADRERARREDQAPRRQDRPRAGRRALHGVRNAAPQPRPQMATVGVRGRRARAQAACNPRRGRHAREARRTPRLRDVQRAAGGERRDRRGVSRRRIRVRAWRRGCRARACRHRARHRARTLRFFRTVTAATASSPRSSSARPRCQSSKPVGSATMCRSHTSSVVPAQAGTQRRGTIACNDPSRWISAFAGMTADASVTYMLRRSRVRGNDGWTGFMHRRNNVLNVRYERSVRARGRADSGRLSRLHRPASPGSRHAMLKSIDYSRIETALASPDGLDRARARAALLRDRLGRRSPVQAPSRSRTGGRARRHGRRQPPHLPARLARAGGRGDGGLRTLPPSILSGRRDAARRSRLR